MRIGGVSYRTVWADYDTGTVYAINQLALPHSFEILPCRTAEEIGHCIKTMVVRGAGLIGAAAGYGMWLGARANAQASEEAFEDAMRACGKALMRTRPTARNLEWAVERQLASMKTASTVPEKVALARATAGLIADEDAAACRAIGLHGLPLIEGLARKKHARTPGAPVNILTHCNAGWLAFVDYGSALAPVYAAHDRGIPVHVWVDETRPRNQGASLTAWELEQHGVPHTLLADNAGGHLMQHGLVDIVLTGADRVTRRGDTANKIGTYLKALAACDNAIPFYVAFPTSTLDAAIEDGTTEIPIEERGAEEVRFVSGKLPDGAIKAVQICPDQTPAANWGFDVTPARLITAFITEKGIFPATRDGIGRMIGA